MGVGGVGRVAGALGAEDGVVDAGVDGEGVGGGVDGGGVTGRGAGGGGVGTGAGVVGVGAGVVGAGVGVDVGVVGVGAGVVGAGVGRSIGVVGAGGGCDVGAGEGGVELGGEEGGGGGEDGGETGAGADGVVVDGVAGAVCEDKGCAQLEHHRASARFCVPHEGQRSGRSSDMTLLLFRPRFPRQGSGSAGATRAPATPWTLPEGRRNRVPDPGQPTLSTFHPCGVRTSVKSSTRKVWLGCACDLFVTI